MGDSLYRPAWRSECARCYAQFARLRAASFGYWITSRFFALDDSAAFVKLNEPVTTTAPSITMILLCAIACLASMNVGTPACARKSASE